MEETRIDDAVLLRRHLGGDANAFPEILLRYRRSVYSVCRRVTGESPLAEDATQAVFVLLSQRARTLVDRVSLAGWLHKTAVKVSQNLVRGEIRRRQREAKMEPPTESSWNEIAPHLDSAIAAMRPQDQEAILLRFGQELTFAQIGTTLGLSENTARMRVERALGRLRDRLTRIGLTASLVGLSTMLSTRYAEAELVPNSDPSVASPVAMAVARQVVRSMALQTALKVAVVMVAVVSVGASVMVPRLIGPATPRPATSEEVSRELSLAVGRWSGQLTYLDDRDRSKHEYETTVTVSGQDNAYRLEASYVGSSAVDVTTIARQADGRYRIENGGESSSHQLNGFYEATKQPDGSISFQGASGEINAEVRFTVDASDGDLKLKEEFRRSENGAFEFRNQFQLRKAGR